MEIQYSNNKIVNEVGKMDFSGNVVPIVWFTTLIPIQKTTLSLVVLILAEIVYWYRPTEIRDESGQYVHFKKKFKEDFLQFSYKQLSDKFQVSEGQAKAAILALEKKGVIQRHFRNITTKTGLKLQNVMYIELIPDELRRLTYPEDTSVSIDQHSKHNYACESNDVCKSNDTPVPIDFQNTKISLETSSEDFIQSFEETEGAPRNYDELKESVLFYATNYPEDCLNTNFLTALKRHYDLSESQTKEIAEIQIKCITNYEDIIDTNDYPRDLVDSLIDISSDILVEASANKKSYQKVLGGSFATAQKNIYKLNMINLKDIISILSARSQKIRNMRSYMCKILLNGPTDSNLKNHYYEGTTALI